MRRGKDSTLLFRMGAACLFLYITQICTAVRHTLLSTHITLLLSKTSPPYCYKTFSLKQNQDPLPIGPTKRHSHTLFAHPWSTEHTNA